MAQIRLLVLQKGLLILSKHGGVLVEEGGYLWVF